MTDLLDLLIDLVRRPSITPADAGCQQVLADRLAARGFEATHLPFADVHNLWLRRGDAEPLFVFLGHTDVVPTGPFERWGSDPFLPTVRDGRLYGRGTADMKASIAAMVVAIERFLAACPEPRGSIAVLLTSDEEGVARHGVRAVMPWLAEQGVAIRWCVVGEPSSSQRLADVVRVGRRGSLHGVLTVRGVQGHVAYPESVVNPIHLAAPALAELATTTWDDGDALFPPTSFQVSNVHAGTGASNVVPGTLEAVFNFRFGPASPEASLRERFEGVLDRHGLDWSVDWDLSGAPFVTRAGPLIDAVIGAVQDETGEVPRCDTGGGTSDGRFVAPTGADVVELGPINATIHKIDEHVAIDDLEPLARIYEGILRRLLG
jgi:succinyl-diaminopimelate desuccinylase